MDLTGMAETIHSVHNYFTLGGSINMERVKAFLKRKQVVISVQTYLIDALGAMAFGLFASLLIGTIFGTLGEKTGVVIKGTDARPFLRRYRRHRGQ